MKKVWSILLSLAMVMTLIPAATTTAFATDPHTHGSGDGAITFDEPIATTTDFMNLLVNGGNGCLTDDIDLDIAGVVSSFPTNINISSKVFYPTPGKTINLCLNGKVLNLNGYSMLLIAYPGSMTKFHIYDCDELTNHSGHLDADGLWHLDKTTYTLQANETDYPITGGIITGGLNTLNQWDGSGGGISVTGAELVLNGGTICGNKASSYYGCGGGVNVYGGGKFTMNGGKICGNAAAFGTEASNYGGGVLVGEASFELNGGEICDNTAQACGGGVCVYYDSNFVMNDGKISHNKSRDGGGIYNLNNTTLNDGEIDNNKATQFGGGVDNDGVLVIKDGVIKNNNASYGGGVYLWCDMGRSLTMTGGTISNNTATNDGAGLFIGDGEDAAYVENCSLGGTARIINNKVGNTPNDLFLGWPSSFDSTTDGIIIGTKTQANTGNGVDAPADGMLIGIKTYSYDMYMDANIPIIVDCSPDDIKYFSLSNQDSYLSYNTNRFELCKIPDNQYKIYVEPCDNGSVTAKVSDSAVQYAPKDTTVTLDVTPATGYQLKSLKYNDGTDHSFTVTDSKYEFTMSENAVTVTAEFEVLPPTVEVTVGEFSGAPPCPTITVPEGVDYMVSGSDLFYFDGSTFKYKCEGGIFWMDSTPADLEPNEAPDGLEELDCFVTMYIIKEDKGGDTTFDDGFEQLVVKMNGETVPKSAEAFDGTIDTAHFGTYCWFTATDTNVGCIYITVPASKLQGGNVQIEYGDTTNEFDTIKEAVDDWTTNHGAETSGTITVMSDLLVGEDEGFTLPQNVTLDLNGKSIGAKTDTFPTIVNNGTIKVYNANASVIPFLIYNAPGNYVAGDAISMNGDEILIPKDTALESGVESNNAQTLTLTAKEDTDEITWESAVKKNTTINIYKGKLNLGGDIQEGATVNADEVKLTDNITLGTDNGAGTLSVRTIDFNSKSVTFKLGSEIVSGSKITDTLTFSGGKVFETQSGDFWFYLAKASLTVTGAADGYTYGTTGKTGYKNAAVTDHTDLVSSLVATYYLSDGETLTSYANSGASASGKLPTKAGTYKVVLSIPDTNGLYYGSSEKITFTIAKASNSISGLSINGWQAGKTPNQPTASATFGTITYKYYTNENCTQGESSIAPTTAGTYWVKATVAESDNYEGAEAIVSFIVSEASAPHHPTGYRSSELAEYEKLQKKQADEKVKQLLSDVVITTRTENQTRGIKVYVNENETLNQIKKAGYRVVFDFYSVQQKKVPTNSKYKITKIINKLDVWYLNTSVKKGKKYYYKAVAKVLDADGNVVATTTLAQCRYGCRTR